MDAEGIVPGAAQAGIAAAVAAQRAGQLASQAQSAAPSIDIASILAAAGQAEAGIAAAIAAQRASQQAVEAQARAAIQRSQHALHHRPAIHARHQARVAYDHALAHYHLEVRHWRHLLTLRLRLVNKLINLEKRIAAMQARQARLTQPARPHVP